MHQITYLPPEQWKDHIIPIRYTTNSYYDIIVNRTDSGFSVTMQLADFPSPVTHTPEEYDYPDKLYADYYANSEAYGIIENGQLMAAVEVWVEEWSKRLRVTVLWVSDELQKRGIGHALMEKAKSIAVKKKCRAIMLETQSCNVNAIGFYLHEGFSLIGFDSCCYANNDLERKEVRIELGILLS